MGIMLQKHKSLQTEYYSSTRQKMLTKFVWADLLHRKLKKGRSNVERNELGANISHTNINLFKVTVQGWK